MERVKTLVVSDSRLPGQESDQATMLVPEGPASVTYQNVTPADPSSTNPIFTIDLPSQNTGLQRTVYWRMAGQFVITGTDLNLLRVQDRVALRQFPLQSMCSSLEVQMNDTTVSIGSLNQILPALLRLSNPSDSGVGTQSSCPSSADWVSDYERAVGRLNSPFRPAGDMEVSSYNSPPRTIGITGVSINGANTELTIVFEVQEPLVIPPFGYTNGSREKAIYGCNQIQIKANMRDFHRGLSLAIGSTATVSGVTMTPSSQSVLAVFVTPNDRALARAMEESRLFRYDYSTVQTFFTTLTSGSVAAGASASGSSNSFQLPIIPEKIIIYATYSETDRQDATQSLPDAFLPITACQVQAGTRAGLLSGATAHDLWQISYKNGAKNPYFNWRGLPQISSSTAAANEANGSGGPLVLDVAADLSLPEGMTPGMAAQWQFAVSSITVENRFANAVTAPRLVVVAITGGFLENEGGRSQVTIGGVEALDADAFHDAPRISSAEYHKNMSEAGFGGKGFLDFLKGIGKTVAKIAAPVASVLLPEAAPLIGAAAHALGAGEQGRAAGGALLAGQQRGGALLGGQRGGALLAGQQRGGAALAGQQRGGALLGGRRMDAGAYKRDHGRRGHMPVVW